MIDRADGGSLPWKFEEVKAALITLALFSLLVVVLSSPLDGTEVYPLSFAVLFAASFIHETHFDIASRKISSRLPNFRHRFVRSVLWSICAMALIPTALMIAVCLLFLQFDRLGIPLILFPVFLGVGSLPALMLSCTKNAWAANLLSWMIGVVCGKAVDCSSPVELMLLSLTGILVTCITGLRVARPDLLNSFVGRKGLLRRSVVYRRFRETDDVIPEVVGREKVFSLVTNWILQESGQKSFRRLLAGEMAVESLNVFKPGFGALIVYGVFRGLFESRDSATSPFIVPIVACLLSCRLARFSSFIDRLPYSREERFRAWIWVTAVQFSLNALVTAFIAVAFILPRAFSDPFLFHAMPYIAAESALVCVVISLLFMLLLGVGVPFAWATWVCFLTAFFPLRETPPWPFFVLEDVVNGRWQLIFMPWLLFLALLLLTFAVHAGRYHLGRSVAFGKRIP